MNTNNDTQVITHALIQHAEHGVPSLLASVFVAAIVMYALYKQFFQAHTPQQPRQPDVHVHLHIDGSLFAGLRPAVAPAQLQDRNDFAQLGDDSDDESYVPSSIDSDDEDQLSSDSDDDAAEEDQRRAASPVSH